MPIQQEPNPPRPVKTPLTFHSNATDERAHTPQVESSASVNSPTTNKSRYRVCVVEDSFKHLTTLFAALNEHAHQADHFANPQEGLAALERDRYDVAIVSDTIAGGSTACDTFVMRVRESPVAGLKTRPILVLTPDNNESRRQQLSALGATPISPSITPKGLHQAIVTAINQIQPSVATIKRILLVEDSYALTWALWNALTAAGHEVDHALSAQDALEIARNARHDLMIIGHHDAGKKPSEQLFGRLRFAKRKTDATIPIIVLSDDLSEADIQSLRRAGIHASLTRDPHRAKNQLMTWLVNGIPRDQFSSATEDATPPVPTLEVSLNFNQGETGRRPTPENTLLPKIDLSTLQPNLTGFPPDWVAEPRVSVAKSKLMLSNPKLIAALIALTLVTAIGWWAWTGGFGGGVNVEVVAVSTSALPRMVRVSGHVISTRQVDLPSTQTGQLYRVYVENGQLVRKGEFLATLDNREATINVRRAEAQVFRLRSELELATETLRIYGNLSNLNADSIPQSALQEMKTSKLLAQNKLRAAENDLQAVQLELERFAINSPFAGMVIDTQAVEGKWIEAGATVYTIADLDALEVALSPSNRNEAESLAVDQTVHLVTDGEEMQEWSQKLSRLSPSSSGTLDAAGAPRHNVLVYSTVDDDAPPLILGQRVRGEVITEVTTSSTTVPAEAVFLHKGKEHMAVVRGNQAKFVPVEVGIRAHPELEITRGVAHGDLVILPRQTLHDGQSILPTRITLPVTDLEASFPLRNQFSKVPRIESSKFEKLHKDNVFIDVRSKEEFDIFRIAEAVNVPLTDPQFDDRVRALRAENKTIPIVFYCASALCPDSYLAVLQAVRSGLKDVYAYDGGLYEWIREHPHHSTLMGINPIPRDRVLSRAYYQARILDNAGFTRLAKQSNTLVVSINFDGENSASIPAHSQSVSMEEFATRLDSVKWRNKSLIIIDGRSDRAWVLQYLLEHKGHKDYFFHFPQSVELKSKPKG